MKPRLPVNSAPRTWWLPVVAALIVLLLTVIFREKAAGPYLAAWWLCLSAPLGAGGLIMLHILTGGRWGSALGPGLRALVISVVPLALLFIPLGLLSATLFHDRPRHDYFSTGPVMLRAIIGLSLWIAGGVFLARAYEPERPRAPLQVRRVAAAGAVMYVVSVSLFALDWTVAIQPQWMSTIAGLDAVAAQALTGGALASLLTDQVRPMRDEDRQDVAGLLLAMVLLHAYLQFSQFFIIWNGDLPHLTSWYSLRTWGAWPVVTWAIVFLELVLPGVLLVQRRLKRSRAGLSIVCILLLSGRLAEAAWLILPSTGSGAGAAALYAALLAALVLLTASMSMRLQFPPRAESLGEERHA